MPLAKKGSSNGHKNGVLIKKLVPPDRKLTKAQIREQNRRMIKNRETTF